MVDSRAPTPAADDAQTWHALNQTIRELHCAGREVAFGNFQRVALELISELIPFDSAWWGNASAEPAEIHSLYLHNCAESILADYLPLMGEDFMRAALIANPGRSINLADLITRARFVRTALYQRVGKRYRIEWSLGTLLVEPVSSLQEFLTLWRHDPKRPFSEAERQRKEWLMPHIADAHRVARLRGMLDDAGGPRRCWAVADERGYLREAPPAFVDFLRTHWPGWHGSRLPDALLPAVRDAVPVRAGQQRVVITPRGGFRYIEVPYACAVDSLTAREREIALRYAQGASHSAIASALGLSAATVRNHLAHCYRKLSVCNKAELVRRVLLDS